MKRVKAGERFAVEGLWMTPEEAALVKQELLARKTKQAERLAQAIGFPSREWQSGSSFDESDPVNAAALRDALLPFPSLCEWLVENAAKLGISDMVPKLRERCDKARAALGTTPADPPILCDAITFIAREMRERTDLDGRGMVDNFHIEYGEYGGFDALELIHAYGELLDECWKRIRDIFTNLAYSAHGVVVFHGPATERLRTLGFYVDRALLSLTASDPTLPPRKSRPDFIIIDDPHNDEVPTDKSIAPTESEATNG